MGFIKKLFQLKLITFGTDDKSRAKNQRYGIDGFEASFLVSFDVEFPSLLICQIITSVSKYLSSLEVSAAFSQKRVQKKIKLNKMYLIFQQLKKRFKYQWHFFPLMLLALMLCNNSHFNFFADHLDHLCFGHWSITVKRLDEWIKIWCFSNN